jgi:hypothetical protein
VCGSNVTEGSNPSLSAIHRLINGKRFLPVHRRTTIPTKEG